MKALPSPLLLCAVASLFALMCSGLSAQDPVVTSLSADSTNVNGGDPVTITMTFDIAATAGDTRLVIGSNSASVTVVNCEFGAPTDGTNTVWTVTIWPYATDNVNGGTFRPLWNEFGTDVLGPEITVGPDTTPPRIISIVPQKTINTAGSSVLCDVTFSEPVTGLDTSDILSSYVSGDNVDQDNISDGRGLSRTSGGDPVWEAGVGVPYGIFTDASTGAVIRISIDEAGSVVQDVAGNSLEVLNTVFADVTITQGAYQSYAIDAGILQWGLDVDSDSDGLKDFQEAMHAQNLLVPGDQIDLHTHFVDIGNETYFAVTIPSQIGLQYTPEFPELGTYASFENSSPDFVTAFRTADDLGQFTSPYELVEVTPSVDSGLPALPEYFEYRTFRFVLPTSQLPGAFIRLDQGKFFEIFPDEDD
jgi:hypothetical protein